MAYPFDEPTIAFDDPLVEFDGDVVGGCVSFDDPSTAFDGDVSFDCGTTVVPPIIPPVIIPTVPGGGASLGRRGPWYPDRTPEQVLREEEEIMVML